MFGVGPVIAATVIGDVITVARFPSRDHFAAYNGTAPVEVSSGQRKIYRLSLRGNRRLNHAVHMAAITQIRHQHSDGRAYYTAQDRRGEDPKEALRCLKRRISDAVYAPADARRCPARRAREGNRGTTLSPARPAHTPNTGSSDKPPPGPKPSLRAPAGSRRPCRHPSIQCSRSSEPLDNGRNKEDSIWAESAVPCWTRWPHILGFCVWAAGASAAATPDGYRLPGPR